VTFLVDGYNLMHASGLARRGLPAGALQKARTRFLDWLAQAAEGRAVLIRVVFDSMKGAGAIPDADHRGIRVRFSRGNTADDEIEEMLETEPRRGGLTVVSNDARLREAARRSGAEYWTCHEFIDWAIDPRPSPPGRLPSLGASEKPEISPSEAEIAAWQAVFSRPPAKRRRP
jgi:predicted RNA-binding protein with PIN domain